jgi:hypothetical protein
MHILKTGREPMRRIHFYSLPDSSNRTRPGGLLRHYQEWVPKAAKYCFWGRARSALKLFVDERFEVFTTVTMKNGVFWDVTPCGSCKNRPFRGT